MYWPEESVVPIRRFWPEGALVIVTVAPLIELPVDCDKTITCKLPSVGEVAKFAVIVPGPFMVADVDAAVDPDIEMDDVELVHDSKVFPVPGRALIDTVAPS